ncbi:MAG: hypothetical protein D6712_14225 [Chloroflexi bacterium]|nr:MAG: hypothetical protein D6712_14225 [Chloroflexota bacterium]
MDEYTTPEEALAPYRRYLPLKLYNWILERAYMEQAAREGKAKRRLTTSDDELPDFTLLSEDEDGHIAQQK